MIAGLALGIVALVVAFVTAPLFGSHKPLAAEASGGGNELWTREKAVAVLAITEADFDRATGKLSEDDYRTLRSDYEGRALHAMDQLEKPAATVAGTTIAAQAVRFCSFCGSGFAAPDAFCGGCGRPRLSA